MSDIKLSHLSQTRAGRCGMVGSLLFLFFFRARYAFLIYSGDDDLHYVLWLKKLIGLPSPISFSNTSYTPGIALLWLPAGLLSRLLAHWWPVDIVLPVLIGLSSFLMWFISYYILDSIACRFNQQHPEKAVGPRWSSWWMLSIPILFYATNRTTLVHPGEVLVAMGIVWAVLNRKTATAFGLSVLLTCVRLNDLPAFALVVGLLIDSGQLKERFKSAVARSFLVCGVLAVSACTVWVLYVGLIRGYNGVTLWQMSHQISFAKLVHVVMGLEWGLLYTGTIWLIVFAFGMVKWRSLSWTARGAWLWMLSEFLVCLGWGDSGEEFAYRYMLGSYVAAVVVYLELRKDCFSETMSQWIDRILSISALWMCYLTWIFKTNANVTIGPIPEGFGNPIMQRQALLQWRHPMMVLRPFFLTPPVTVVYSWIFPHRSIVVKYALSGFPLVAITFATTIAVGVFLVCARMKKQSPEQPPIGD
jgi:hypothetical protein